MIQFTHFQSFPKIPKSQKILERGQKFQSRDKIPQSENTGRRCDFITFKGTHDRVLQNCNPKVWSWPDREDQVVFFYCYDPVLFLNYVSAPESNSALVEIMLTHYPISIRGVRVRAVLNMIQFLDHNPTTFYNSESNPVSSEIFDLRNFWLHTMYACTE